MKPESKTSETKLMRRMTPAQRKRLKTRQRLLDAVESAERAYIETISVAKALDRSFSDAAMAAQEVHWNLSKALKRLAAHKEKMIATSDKTPQADGLERTVDASARIELHDNALGITVTPAKVNLLEGLIKNCTRTGAAVDRALAEIAASSKRIELMERLHRRAKK